MARTPSAAALKALIDVDRFEACEKMLKAAFKKTSLRVPPARRASFVAVVYNLQLLGEARDHAALEAWLINSYRERQKCTKGREVKA